MSELRIGIIGLGNMGSDHARKLIHGAVPEVRLRRADQSMPA
ncbi:hypothetical protein [Cohnella sp. REN36]